MHKYKYIISFLFLMMAYGVFAQSFVNTRDYSVKRTASQQKAFSAELEYPISGPSTDVVTSIRAWVTQITMIF